MNNAEDLNIKILVCAHKITPTLETNNFKPILLGTEYRDSETRKYFQKYLFDNIGDNISTKQPNYAELSAIYWAWKNIELLGDADYIGFFHYRRFLNFKEKIRGMNPWEYAFFDFRDETKKSFGWTKKDIEDVCGDADIIVTESEKILDPDDWVSPATLEIHYKKAHYAEDFDMTIETIEKLYPDYIDVIDDFKNTQTGHYCNVFIMKREMFVEYAEWLFSILFEMEKYIDVKDEKYNGSNDVQRRVFGFLGERLLNCFIIYQRKKKGVKIGEYQRLVGYLTTKEKKMFETQYGKYHVYTQKKVFFVRFVSGIGIIFDGIKYFLKRKFR